MSIVFFDLETQKLLDEVGGRAGITKLRVACAVTWSSARNDFAVYWEKDIPALIAELKAARRVVGFNVKEFDYEVLQPYAPFEKIAAIPTLDMLDSIYRVLRFRVSLDSLARASLNETKTADGIQSVTWFKEGKLDLVAEYCKADVDITRRVFEFGRANGFVYYLTKLGSKQRVNVNWSV